MAATSKQWTVLDTKHGFDGLTFGEANVQKVADYEVLVKFHAASLNYRDLVIPKVKASTTVITTTYSSLLSF